MATTALRTIALPAGERVPALGQGTWRMAEGPTPRPGGDRQPCALGLDLGHDADRHRRDVRRRRRRGARRRSDRGPARRGLPGQQGAAAPRDARTARSPPASAACSASRPIRSISTCFTGAAAIAAGGDARGASTRSSRRQDPLLGRQQLRRRRTWRSSSTLPGGAAVRDRPGALQPRRAAASSTTCCRGAARSGSRSWPTRRSTRAGCSSTRRFGAWPSGTRRRRRSRSPGC